MSRVVARVLVLPSPLLGPAAYGAFVDALVHSGCVAQLAPGAIAQAADRSAPGAAGLEGRDPAAPRTTADRLVEEWTEHAARLDATALVAHSNAGYLAPAVRAGLGRALPVIFMDAALPPVSGPTTLAPEGFRAFLATLAEDTGRLPPWTRWWPPEDLADLGPTALLEAVERDCPRVPVAYFDAIMSPPTGWADAPNGYIAFGDTYAQEADFAEAAGWPVEHIAGQHLHHTVAPDAVARAVLALLAALAPS